MSFVISTDTSANLPIELVRDNGLLVVPFTYIVDGQPLTCEDSSAFDGDAFYASLDKAEVKTSMVNVGQYRQAWEPVLAAGNDIVHISMSSGISGAFDASLAAAEALRKDYPAQSIMPIDTRAASLGEGMFVLRAIAMRKAGKTAEEVVQALTKCRPLMRQIFTVEDLMHLKRGGRLSGMAALIGTVLSIKPILKGNELGQIVVEAKTRSRKSAFKYLAEAFKKEASNSKEPVCIAHCGCPDDAGFLAGLIKKIRPEQKIMTVYYEPVTGSHVGPGAVALFFWKQRP